MSVDREQIRREPLVMKHEVQGSTSYARRNIDVVTKAEYDALLAELEQAEREREEWKYRYNRIFPAYEARLAKADALAEALRMIRDLPSEHDLLYNAEAKALWYIAGEALAAYEQDPVAEGWPVPPGVVANDDPERWG